MVDPDYIKGGMKVKRIIVVLMPFFFFSLSAFVYAEKIHIYKHKNGNIVITNIGIPEEQKTEIQEKKPLKHDVPPDKPQIKNVPAVQSAQAFSRKDVEKEKKRLEEEIKRLKQQEAADRGNAPYYQFYLKAYEDGLKLLIKDPAGYFNKQDELEKEAAKILHGQAPPRKM